MKYTDRYFEFPVRVYDRFTAEKALKMEENIEAPQEGDWIMGYARLPYKEITVWSDYFDSTQGVEGVAKDGFDTTIVWTRNEGIFLCTLKKDKFEKLLNEHVDKMEELKYLEDRELEERISKATGTAVIVK